MQPPEVAFLPCRSITVRCHMNVCRVHLRLGGRSAHSAESIQSVSFLRFCSTIISFTNLVKQYATRIPEMRVFHHRLYFWCTGSSCRKSALREVRKDTTARPKIETWCLPGFLCPLIQCVPHLKTAIYAKVSHWTTRKKWIENTHIEPLGLEA